MSNLAIVKEPDDSAEPQAVTLNPLRDKPNWLRLLLRLAACGLLVSSLVSYALTPVEGILDTSIVYRGGISVILAILFIAYVQPRLTFLLAVLTISIYLQRYDVPRLALSTASYLVLCGFASLLAARRILREVLPDLANASGSAIIIGNLIFFSLVFFNSFLLLGVGAYSAKLLIACGAFWAVTMLTLERKFLRRHDNRTILQNSASTSTDPLTDFFATVCGLLLLFSAFMYFYPGAITQDADKGYLAIAKFYVRNNSLLIGDPGWSRMNMRAFPHMQEIILSAGFLIGKNIGAKLLAWLIILAKFHALYFIGLHVCRFSRQQSLLTVLLFGMSPLMLELHSVVRPENLLTLFCLSTVFALEHANKAREEQEWNRAIRFVILAAILGIVTISVKYTAFFFLLACGIVYWRVVWFAFANFAQTLRRGWLPLAVASTVGGFWYLRNLIFWDQLVSMTPRGTYHLTVWFPPLRSITEIWTFLQEGLVRTRTYTEFPDFAYGPFGWLIIPALLLGLSGSGPVRRVSGIALLYAALLLGCSRQIRYLAIVLPFAYLAIVYAIAVADKKFRRPTVDDDDTRRSLYFAIVVVCSIIALQVSQGELAVVGARFQERIDFQDKDFGEVSYHFKDINRRVPYPALAMVSGLDANYEIDARLYRVDPIRTIGKIKKNLASHPFSHFLINDFAVHSAGNYLFGDRELMQSLAQEDITAGSLRMLPIDFSKTQQLFEYVARVGWDANKTLIVSEPHWQRHSFTFERGEQLEIANMPHRLFRVSGIWEPRGYYSFGSTPLYQPGAKLAWYFEQVDSSTLLAKQNLTARITTEGLQHTVSEHGIPGFVLPPHAETGWRDYQIFLPAELQEGPLVADLYVRALRALPTDQLHFAIGEQRIEYPLRNSLLHWEKLTQYEFEAGSIAQLPVAVELQSSTGSSATFFRELRVVLRRPSKHTTAIFEDFKSPLQHSSGLRFSTRRAGVTVSDQHEMILEPGASRGYKSYRFFVPASFGTNVNLEVFARGAVDDKNGLLKLQLRTPHSGQSVAASREISNWSSIDDENPLINYSFVRRQPQAATDYDVEIRLELEGSAHSPRVSELTIRASSDS